MVKEELKELKEKLKKAEKLKKIQIIEIKDLIQNEKNKMKKFNIFFHSLSIFLVGMLFSWEYGNIKTATLLAEKVITILSSTILQIAVPLAFSGIINYYVKEKRNIIIKNLEICLDINNQELEKINIRSRILEGKIYDEEHKSNENVHNTDDRPKIESINNPTDKNMSSQDLDNEEKTHCR